jgi:hypothetical protein
MGQGGKGNDAKEKRERVAESLRMALGVLPKSYE